MLVAQDVNFQLPASALKLLLHYHGFEATATTNPNKFFLVQVALYMVFYHSNTKVTDTQGINIQSSLGIDPRMIFLGLEVD